MCRAFQPYCLQPPHAVPLSCSLDRTGFPLVWELGFASTQQARHSIRPNRVRILRSGCSSPVAFHLASRHRGYLRLRAGTSTRRELSSLWLNTLSIALGRARHDGKCFFPPQGTQGNAEVEVTVGAGRRCRPIRLRAFRASARGMASCLRHDVICFFITLRMEGAKIFALTRHAFLYRLGVLRVFA